MITHYYTKSQVGNNQCGMYAILFFPIGSYEGYGEQVIVEILGFAVRARQFGQQPLPNVGHIRLVVVHQDGYALGGYASEYQLAHPVLVGCQLEPSLKRGGEVGVKPVEKLVEPIPVF